MRRSMTVVSAMPLATTTLLVAAPAHAVACARGDTNNYANDWARTVDINGYCGTVGARHHYNPAWSGNDYWTAWKYDADAAQDASAAEMYAGQHSNSAG